MTLLLLPIRTWAQTEERMMRPRLWQSAVVGLFGVVCALRIGDVGAQTLDQVVEAGEAKVAEGQASQQRVDKIVDAQQGKLIRYRALLKQIEGLEQYNEQLATQVQGQLALIEQFDSSVEQVAQIERQMLPLITRMSDALGDFVELDLPFHEIERAERLAFVRNSIGKADVSVAEKFRQVIEAYQIENDYGRKIDSYQDIIELDGEPREVDVLRFGRVALAAQTKDADTTAVWDRDAGQWQVVDAGDYRNSIRHGIRMAKKQASIEMITLPVPAPEAAQ
ncbi:DUF3450 domain-containing protein [Sinimarinibacterium flocculans]|uniref:DUF3450 domain-containing protein n=1 Tax=Sinimarinibacterium flocculans TaxID=985250 RepID=UPI0035148AC1